MPSKAEIEAAAEEMNNHGIDIGLPWDGDLDDLERERFDALVAALEAAERVRGAAAANKGRKAE
jgi:hypothetical protein